MRSSARLLLVLTVFLLPASAAQSPPADIEAFFQQYTDAWMRRNPDLVVSTRYFDGEELDRASRQLTPVSREHELESIRIAREGLAQLARFDRATLTPAQRESADVMRWQLEELVASEPWLDYNFPLQQMSGVNVNLPNTFTVVHPLNTARDARNYVARLREVDARMGEAAARSRRQAEQDILPPRFILEVTIGQMRRFIEAPPAGNPLVTEFARKLRDVADLDDAGRAALTAAATTVVEHEVYPAWRAAIVVLEAQLTDADTDAGLWRFASGQQIYAAALRRFTTTSLSAAEIHAIGRREVARIEFEMDRLLRQLGYVEGSIAEREARLSEDLAYPETAEGRAQIMRDIDALIADALRRTASSFDLRPKTAVIAQPYPEFRWANAAASYTAPAADGSRPGIYQMPLRRSYLTRFGLRTLVYHETVPGHHFQIALATENASLPAFRRFRAFGGISASAEGWALYSERFAVEDGWYAQDTAGLIGQLSDALFRARRLVVDTGLHALGWTRQQAIDYGIEASEVERYVVMPGQATSYMIGRLEIERLREKARAALGARFSLREFHNIVLGVGIVPLAVLEFAVDEYIVAESCTRSGSPAGAPEC